MPPQMAKKPVLSRAERSRRTLEQARLNPKRGGDSPRLRDNVEITPHKPVELTFNWQGDLESQMLIPVEITPETHPHLAKTLDVANQMARGDIDNELNGSVESALEAVGGKNVFEALVAGVQNWHVPQKER